MKKLITILCVVALSLSVSAQRQGDTRFGIVAGLNIAYPVGNDMEDFIDDFDDAIDDYDDEYGVDAEGGVKPRIGMHLGFVFDYFLADNIALSSGFIYSQKGFVVEQDIKGDQYIYNYPYGYYTNIKRELRIATQLNYFDIPIGIKYATDEGFEISGGLMLSILASDKVEADLDYDGPSSSSYYEDQFDDIDDYEDLWDEDPEGTILGFNIGVGYTFNEKFNISFKLQKTGNFGEIVDENDNQNLTLQFSAGVYF
jgi:hypothetical protein